MPASNGKRAIGGAAYNELRAGKRLTQRRLIQAMHYHCMCGYADGLCDCWNLECPLHETHPYRGVRSPFEVRQSQRPSTEPVSIESQAGGIKP